MAEPLSFTPAFRAAEDVADAPVRRRHVLFVPGYDPEGETRYRMLFVREMIRYGKRFGLARREISRAEKLPDLPGVRWTAEVAAEGWSTRTTYDVLRWDDIVLRDFRRPLPVVVVLLFAGLLYSLLTGGIARCFRLNWRFGGVVIYPSVMIALALAAALGVGLAVDALLAGILPAAPFARAALVLGIAGLVIAALHPVYEGWFVWHLMHDWVFNCQIGLGWKPDYDARADRFCDHLLATVEAGGFDELLVVGHSSGATLALDVVGRALERDPALARRGGAVALLTVGTCMPLTAFNPAAGRYRGRMATVMGSPDVLWAEYQAPQDWLNVAGFNPVRDVPLPIAPPACVNPVIRSSRFRETVAEATYRSIVFRPFRMHFQFLIANDRPGEYDYIMMATGPLSLRRRVQLGAEAASATLATSPVGDPPAAELAAAEHERVASHPA